MNSYPGILGRKVGMTQLVAEDGTITPATVILAKCVVVGKRSIERDGYTALILGIDDRKSNRTNKALAGQYRTAMGALKNADGTPPAEQGKVTPRQVLREFRCAAEYADTLQIGDSPNLEEIFKLGMFVDVRSSSRGRGFTGVMRRHNFAGAKRSHGAHEVMRHGGSIGTNMTPGRVLPGKKMAGQHGNKPTTVMNQKIVQILAEEGLVLVRGGVPGTVDSIVEVRGANKKNGGMKGVA
ncbi:MAG: hypothetical protein RJA70_1959 [Pseudomonadota bacterium]